MTEYKYKYSACWPSGSSSLDSTHWSGADPQELARAGLAWRAVSGRGWSEEGKGGGDPPQIGDGMVRDALVRCGVWGKPGYLYYGVHRSVESGLHTRCAPGAEGTLSCWVRGVAASTVRVQCADVRWYGESHE